MVSFNIKLQMCWDQFSCTVNIAQTDNNHVLDLFDEADRKQQIQKNKSGY